ncbi:hypothetical protein VZT92_025791 [Zoarces viviparus]|uniref:Breast carcinoma-amplified sequence 1 n=1 Tax=Zoarces viviparus TaxID=48416 RepID=A0AAW1DY52_ZOAVI
MGNEHSKDDELLNTIGTIPEMLDNVKGTAGNISSNGLEITVNGETTVQQNSKTFTLNLTTESNDFVIVESDAAVVSQILETILLKEEVKENNVDQTDVGLPASDPQTETANLKPESESLTEPESVTLVLGPEGEKAPESDKESSQPVENQEDSNPEKSPVMNFFKTLATVKIIKKDTGTADATKDQSQKENQPAATTTVAQVSEPPAAPKGMSIPPPPPPEPPKMEIKAEPAAKPSPKEEPKAAAKESESPKGKSAKLSIGKFFGSKVLVGVKASKDKASASGANAPAKSAAVKKVDSSKDDTLEAAAKPEPPPPVKERKKTLSRFSLFKPKKKVDFSKDDTLEAAAKPEPPPPVKELKKTLSRFSLFKPKADDPKKATPAPAAAAETAKAKEEPKAAAKSSEAAVDNKPASVAAQAEGDAANAPKKVEKKSFFKSLGQKRNSTDAGIQTEPVTVAPAAEKAK